ncbi:MAG: autotransporter-associated beta strand repeat-containing protein [Kiritimatiellae bacterium]|nr:autotransporter-associated beta strand repeat-containing protein [Kiritimatiellia bacterium]
MSEIRRVAVVVVAMVVGGEALAQTYTWTQTGSGVHNWSTAGNWTPGAPPVGGDPTHVIVVNAAGANNTALNDLAGSFRLNQLHLRAGNTIIAGNTLVFTNNGTTMPAITNGAGGFRIIQNDLVFGTNIQFVMSQGQGLLLTGNVGLGGNVLRQIDTWASATTWATVTNSGTVSNGGIRKIGQGQLVLSGANTYSAGTRVEAGVLQFNSAASIGGTGANVTNDGGAVAFHFPGVMAVATTRLGLISVGTLAISPTNSSELIDFSLPLFTNTYLGAVGTVYYDLANHIPKVSGATNVWRLGGGAGSLIVTSSIGGADSVVIGGGGQYSHVLLAGNNSYSGETLVHQVMHLLITNANQGLAVGLGSSPRLVVSNATVSFGNAIVTNTIISYGGVVSPMYNFTLIRFVPGTTNVIEGPIVAIGGFAAKVNVGSGVGLHIVRGGVIGTNVGVAFYDDTVPNPIILTNKPVLLGTSGTLSGHNLFIGVQSNVVGLLNIDWGQGGHLTVPNAFVGAPGLKLGVSGSSAINWLNLNGYDHTVGFFIVTNQTPGLVYSHYIMSTNPATLTFHNPTNRIYEYEGRFTGAVSLVKSGQSTLRLHGTNFSTGATVVQGGALVVLPVGGIVQSPVTVNGGSLLLPNATNILGASATLTVNAGGAVGATYGLDQTFIDDIYIKMGGASPTYALGSNSSSAIDFSDPFRPALQNAFLGAAPVTNVLVFSGTVAWGNNNVRLGGGGGVLEYRRWVGVGTNLVIGTVGGDPNSVVFLPITNAHDRTIIQSGTLAVSNDSVLGMVPFDLTETNIVLRGGSLIAAVSSFQTHPDRRIGLDGPGGGLGADTGLTLFVRSPILSTGWLTKVGAGGAVLLSPWNTYSGGTILREGVLNITNEYLGATGAPLVFSGGVLQVSANMTLRNRAITMAANGTMLVDTTAVLQVTNSISGPGALVKAGMGHLWLTGSNTFSGGLIVSGIFERHPNSRVLVSNAYALGTGPIILTNGGQLFVNSGVLTVTNPLVLHGGDQSTSYSGALQAFNGSDVTWSGPVAVSGALTRVTVWNNSTLRLTGGIIGDQPVNFSAQNGSIIIQGQPITVTNVGLYYFSGGNNNLGTNYLNVAGNTMMQVRIWQGGLLVLGVENALPTNVNLTIGDLQFNTRGTLDLNGYNQRIANLFSGTNFMASFVTNRSATHATFTVVQTLPTNYLGQFSGNMSFEKRGPAELKLHADSFHTGATRILEGALTLITNGALSASSTIEIGAGAQLTVTGRLDQTLTLNPGQTLKGEGTLRGGLIVGNGATLSPGTSPGVLTVIGDVALQSGSTFEVEVLGPLAGQYDQLLMTSSSMFTPGGATLSILAPNPLTLGLVFPIVTGWGAIAPSTFAGLPDGATVVGGVNTFQINYGTLTGYEDDVTLTVIPEPATLALVGLSAAVFVLRRRLR